MVDENKDFKNWMQKVDREFINFCGMGYLDLPDYYYYDLFDSEYTPKETVQQYFEDNEEYSYLLNFGDV